MSELKATTVYDAYWKANSVGEGTGVLVYLKSEADKVIAEKDKELRHQKYKRCLAMTLWCHSMWILLRDEHETKRSVFYWRWWNLWLELAEKFKEAK